MSTADVLGRMPAAKTPAFFIDALILRSITSFQQPSGCLQDLISAPSQLAKSQMPGLLNNHNKNPMLLHNSTRAAIYVRMSTESQNYSTDHQRTKIKDYAAIRGIEITREYADQGKSGLDIRRRPGLTQLIKDVQSGQANFNLIIVYDVSRWGRFQDIDEAAYHEHTCRRANIDVVYCAEHFANDGGPFSALLKSMKRTMAAEYSRELSNKVFDAQCRFIDKGFKQGGHAGYGLRRLAITEDGAPHRILHYGEGKGVATNRVVLVPGPKHEIAVVRRVYELYLDEQHSDAGIARILNSEGVQSEFGRPWTHTMVNSILTNVKYHGTLAYNRRSCKLSSRRKKNHQDDWVRNVEAIEPLISPLIFDQAQVERVRRARRYQPEELIQLLHACHLAHGRVNAKIIASDPAMPDPQLLVRSFGSLIKAYDAAGLPRRISLAFVETRKFSREKQRVLFDEVCRCAKAAGSEAYQSNGTCLVVIDKTLRVHVNVMTVRRPRKGLPNWKIRQRPESDYVITARLDRDSGVTIDYFLVSAVELARGPIYIKASNLEQFKKMQHQSVASIFGLPDTMQ